MRNPSLRKCGIWYLHAIDRSGKPWILITISKTFFQISTITLRSFGLLRRHTRNRVRVKPASGSAIRYPLRRRSELRHYGHGTMQVHTVGLSVDVCRLATDARVAAHGDFVNVLVNAGHVLLFDKLNTSTMTRRTMCHDHCYMLRFTTSSVTPIFAKPNVRNSSGTVRTKLVDRTSYGPEHELKLRCRGPLRQEDQGQGTVLI